MRDYIYRTYQNVYEKYPVKTQLKDVILTISEHIPIMDNDIIIIPNTTYKRFYLQLQDYLYASIDMYGEEMSYDIDELTLVILDNDYREVKEYEFHNSYDRSQAQEFAEYYFYEMEEQRILDDMHDEYEKRNDERREYPD